MIDLSRKIDDKTLHELINKLATIEIALERVKEIIDDLVNSNSK